MFNYKQVFENKNNILFVTAHPDDVIVFFGALIHKLRQEQKNVYVVLATNGARGSRQNTISETELAKIRMAEEANALKVLGVDESHLFCLGYADGEMESNLKLIGEVAYYLRKFKIDMVCTHEPRLQCIKTYQANGYFVQHRDHRKIGEAVIDAVYPFSRDRSFFPEHYVEGIEPHSVHEILLTDESEANFDFDCTEYAEIKKQAMREHKSQFSSERIEEIMNAFKYEGKDMERFRYIKISW